MINNIKLFLKLNKIGYLKEKGFFNSFNIFAPEDSIGNPIPWLTYSFVDFLVPRLNNTVSIFEYGSGNSTLFFSKHVKRIVTLEHDRIWAEKLRKSLPGNCQLIISSKQKEDYINNIEKTKECFNLIIIDGLFRNECAINAPKYLNSSGVIIFDDSNRTDYEDGFKYLNENNYKRLDFWGLSPGSIRNNCTSIFYLEQNCLGI